ALVSDMSAKKVARLCKRIEKAVGEYCLEINENETARVGISLGAASYPESGETFDQIIDAADKVRYKQKMQRKANAPDLLALPPQLFVEQVSEPVSEPILEHIPEPTAEPIFGHILEPILAP